MPPRRGRWAGPGGSAPSGRARGDGWRRRRARPAARARCTVPRWKTCPSTAPRPIMSRSPEPSRSSRDCRSAWIVGGTTISASPPFSLTIASISSMKSGFPSAACRILSRTSSVICAPPASREINSSQSSTESASSRIVVALSLPPPQPGRSSSSSGRATQSRKIGASRDQSETCSIRSRKTGSAHWMSSKTTICGRSAARASISLRKESCVSAGRAADHLAGVDADRDQDLDERPVGDVLAVVDAAAAQHVGRLACGRRGTPRSDVTCRPRPARAA